MTEQTLWFAGITDLTDLKAEYNRLAKLHHPDRGGDAEIMKEINLAYERVMTEILTGRRRERMAPDPEQTEEAEVGDLDIEVELAEVLARVSVIPGVEVEICGAWIWVTGDTRPVKDQIKESGCFWSKNKQAWYWRPPNQKRRWRRGGEEWSMDEIRERHGSRRVRAGRVLAGG